MGSIQHAAWAAAARSLSPVMSSSIEEERKGPLSGHGHGRRRATLGLGREHSQRASEGDGEVDITEFDITESDVTFYQEIDITESDVTKKGN